MKNTWCIRNQRFQDCFVFQHPNAESVRKALRLMITSAARLQVECRSSALPERNVDQAMLTQQVCHFLHTMCLTYYLVIYHSFKIYWTFVDIKP